MSYCLIDPISDGRWDGFVASHPSSSIFHTSGWLTALKHTYQFEPAAITTCAPGQELTNAIVFCRVRSWLTGPRLVSLPFSDHCAPLVGMPEQVQPLLEGLCRIQALEKWNHVELRPLPSTLPDTKEPGGFSPGKRFAFHTLDLHPQLDAIARAFHKDCVMRKIRRAERDGLGYEEGRSEAILDKFYGLQVLTRRRQNTPAQPYRWFKNLVEYMDRQLTIRVASLNGKPVAGILTIEHRDTVVYKYGCSDERYSAHGGTQMLFYRAIQKAKETGMRQFDFGRSDLENAGLIAFKDRWGCLKSELVYLRCPAFKSGSQKDRTAILAKKAAAVLPKLPISFLGTALYRHFA